MWTPHTSLSASAAAPQGAYADNTDALGAGVTLFGGIQFTDSPIMAGLELGFYSFARQNAVVPLSFAPDVGLRMSTTSGMSMAHAVVRARKTWGRVSPYGEALIGLRLYSTDTQFNELDRWITPVVDNHRDVAASYGAGVGMDIYLFKAFGAHTSLSLGVRYLRGGYAEYAKPQTLRLGENFMVDYETQGSRTDVLITTLGFNVRPW